MDSLSIVLISVISISSLFICMYYCSMNVLCKDEEEHAYMDFV